MESNMDPVKQWEELRRLARRFEGEIDSKLLSFGKLLSVRFEANFMTKFEDEQPLINSKETFEQLALDIDSSISSLQDINLRMDDCSKHLPNKNTILYTLQRHQEILNDYRKEFVKLRTNIENKLNRHLLLDQINDYNGLSMPNHSQNDFLQKESDHILNSEMMINDQINIAIRTRETLRNQRSNMKFIQTQLTTLANKFPMINNVLHSIGFKKRKDSIILAIVIGICLFILLVWFF